MGMIGRVAAAVVGVVVLAVVGLAGCAHTLPDVPGKGGPPWLAIESDDFVVWTDLREPDGKALAGDLEDFRQALVDNVFVGAPRPKKKGIVIAFADSDDWRLFGDRPIDGFFVGPDNSPYRMPALFLPATAIFERKYVSVGKRTLKYEYRSDPVEIRQHELTHMLMNALVADTPPWFDEGVAQIFESAKLDAQARTITFGAFPESMRTRRVRLVDIDGLVHARRGVDIENASFYTTAHILVSFLMNQYPDELEAYVQALKAAPRDQRYKVWDQVFSGSLAAEMQHDMALWLQKGSVRTFTSRLAPHVDNAAVKGRLGDADVYGTRAILYTVLGAQQKQAAILENLRACVASDSSSVSCNLYLTVLDKSAAIDATGITAVHPDDWRAWLLAVSIAEKKHDDAQRDAMARRMCEVAADDDVPDKLRELCRKLPAP